jgi:uncharacterized MAPEG superfamily protein
MEMFDAYSHAIAALALWAVLVCVLSMLSAGARGAKETCACGKPKRDYSDPAYRRERAFMNAIEGGGPFVAVTVAAILIGASAFWVNLFASLYLVARIAMAVVHIGTLNQPLRSVCFVIGLVNVLALAVLVLRAAF